MSAFFIIITIMKPLLYLFKLSLFFFVIHCSHAEPVFSIAPGIMYFNYEEFDDNKVTLDTEIGFIPGFSFNIQEKQNSIGVHIFSGEVEYDGQTQSGIPVITDTDESLYYFYFRHDIQNNNKSHNFFIGVNYNIWERFIQGTPGVSSLYEEYKWWHIEAGLTLERSLINNTKFKLELAGLRNFNGTMLVDLDSFGYGSPTLNLGDKFGLRSLLSVDLKTDVYSTMSVGVEYKYWGFGKSNTETLSNGIDTISILEPESTSNLLRFFVQFTQAF